ncbi:MAG TPA: CAAX prenyl protease-related protein [Isosphaeraceae bacterium]|nr:CAAX prenyl protease-related protein [Isosphaeraceae bacterium]
MDKPRASPPELEAAGAPTRPALPYVIPMAAFLALTAVEGMLPPDAGGRPGALWYPLTYTLKVAIVTGLAWACRSAWRDLAPPPGAGVVGLSTLLGLAVTAAWVGLDGHYPTLASLGARTAFDPEMLPPVERWAFLAVRFAGLVALVPLIEELFWRSFLMRWVIDDEFTKVSIGRVTPAALAATSGLFALAHPEWLPALLTGLAWAWLVWRTKSLSACVISHATANLALGLYVIATGAWKFW